MLPAADLATRALKLCDDVQADQACSQVTPARNMPMPSPTQDDISLPFAWVEDPDASGCLWLISPNAHHVKRATSPVQDALQACTTPSPYHSVPLEPPSSPGQAWPQMTAAGKRDDCAAGNHAEGSASCTADCTQAEKAVAEAPLSVIGHVNQRASRGSFQCRIKDMNPC